MTRLEACIDALMALQSPYFDGGNERGNKALDNAIAIITRILSAEPSEDDIERAAKAILDSLEYAHTKEWRVNEYGEYKPYYNDAARAALLTAFPQQEKL